MLDQRFAPEEIARVGFGEGAQPLVGVAGFVDDVGRLLVQQHRRYDSRELTFRRHAERGRQAHRIRIALGRVFGRGLLEHGIERVRQVRVAIPQRGQRLVELLVE